MAYAALTSLAGVIEQILPQDQRYISLCGKDQMESLHEKVSLLQEFLEYISLRSFLPDFHVFESRIIDTAYKLEDTIELVILKEPGKSSTRYVLLPTPDGRKERNKKKRIKKRKKANFTSYFKDVHVLIEEAMKMKKVLDNNVIPLSLLHPTSSREVPGSKGTKVGIDKALNQILDQITRQSYKLRIIPIIGMGGIGKTTLARASYEAPRTLHHFDVRFWVTVSQEYDIQQILRGLLPEAKQTGERLIEHVHKNLKGRRYLIVLDDMWDEKAWDRIRNAFPDDDNGSRVILTTRSSGVASNVGSSSHVHEMQFLNEDQSWYLLRENVYGHECCSNEFENTGRLIAKNCKGLPLAVVVIAGLLKFNKTKDYWEQIARNTKEVTTCNNHLFEILSWSYNRLPPHLKACFLYMGAYKEDYDIPVKELVRLWAAEGFLKPKQSRSMEEVAEECLEELVERSLVLVTKTQYSGKIKTCSVHDVIREVSIRKAEEERFHYHFRSSVDQSTFRNVLSVQRRVSITNCDIGHFPHDTFCVTTHSLIEQGVHFSHKNISISQCSKLVRVLQTTRIGYDPRFSILCTLTNLRYLHLVNNYSSRLTIMVPESISTLQNLETLIIDALANVVFPLEIWNLQRLRHIIVEKGGSNLQFPVAYKCCPVLSNLQTLSRMQNFSYIRDLPKKLPI